MARRSRTRRVERSPSRAAARRTATLFQPLPPFRSVFPKMRAPRRSRDRIITRVTTRVPSVVPSPRMARVPRDRGQPRVIAFRQRARVPSRVLRRPTRIRPALVREANKSSKRARACKCSDDRSEAQREVTRRFIAGYGGRPNMQKKIGLCSCH